MCPGLTFGPMPGVYNRASYIYSDIFVIVTDDEHLASSSWRSAVEQFYGTTSAFRLRWSLSEKKSLLEGSTSSRYDGLRRGPAPRRSWIRTVNNPCEAKYFSRIFDDATDRSRDCEIITLAITRCLLVIIFLSLQESLNRPLQVH